MQLRTIAAGSSILVISPLRGFIADQTAKLLSMGCSAVELLDENVSQVSIAVYLCKRGKRKQ